MINDPNNPEAMNAGDVSMISLRKTVDQSRGTVPGKKPVDSTMNPAAVDALFSDPEFSAVAGTTAEELTHLFGPEEKKQ